MDALALFIKNTQLTDITQEKRFTLMAHGMDRHIQPTVAELQILQLLQVAIK
jgi:hypothetical protein